MPKKIKEKLSDLILEMLKTQELWEGKRSYGEWQGQDEAEKDFDKAKKRIDNFIIVLLKAKTKRLKE